jgi:hypothetical protein
VQIVGGAYPSYFSIKALRASSDSVLLGTFGGKTSSQLDNGGNPADTSGIPMALYEFQVSKVLSGRDLGPRVEVAVIDAPTSEADVSLQPRTGEEVVIFARVLSATNAPALKFSGPTVNAVGGNNGVFDVAYGRAKARLHVVSTDVDLIPAEPSNARLLELSLPELELEANKPS